MRLKLTLLAAVAGVAAFVGWSRLGHYLEPAFTGTDRAKLYRSDPRYDTRMVRS